MTQKLKALECSNLDVSIDVGMPIFNGGEYIERSIKSILDQTFQRLTLTISDNASTDMTQEICLAYAKVDPRIRYFRQHQNIGVVKNFQFVLNKATSPYFMWAAADDYWHPEFIASNLYVLENHCEVVASISKVRMERLTGRSESLVGTYALDGSYTTRLRLFFKCLGANSRFYSVYRREVIKQSFSPLEFMGGVDGATLVKVIEFGSLYEVKEVLMERSCYGSSSKLLTQQFSDYNMSNIEKVFPLLKFSIWFWQNTSIKTFVSCFDCLLRVNLWFTMIVLTEVLGVRQLVRKMRTNTSRFSE